MTPLEIRPTLPAYSPVVFYDSSYATPILDWLLGPFYDWFPGWLKSMGLKGVWERKFDCDDFALLYVLGCKIAHANTAQGTSESIAVGVFCYHSARGPHAIVTAYTDKGQVFIEPQTGKQIYLTEAERLTCFSASF